VSVAVKSSMTPTGLASSASRLNRGHEPGHEAHDLHVLGAALGDAWALDLEHHLRAIVELGGVDLSDRGRGQGLLGDLDQPGRALGPEILVEDAADLGERERPHSVEDLLELLDVAIGEQASRRRDDLTELDEGSGPCPSQNLRRRTGRLRRR
jgi:hypothetical protein